jgi:hypothetical protein
MNCKYINILNQSFINKNIKYYDPTIINIKYIQKFVGGMMMGADIIKELNYNGNIQYNLLQLENDESFSFVENKNKTIIKYTKNNEKKSVFVENYGSYSAVYIIKSNNIEKYTHYNNKNVILKIFDKQNVYGKSVNYPIFLIEHIYKKLREEHVFLNNNLMDILYCRYLIYESEELLKDIKSYFLNPIYKHIFKKYEINNEEDLINKITLIIDNNTIKYNEETKKLSYNFVYMIVPEYKNILNHPISFKNRIFFLNSLINLLINLNDKNLYFNDLKFENCGYDHMYNCIILDFDENTILKYILEDNTYKTNFVNYNDGIEYNKDIHEKIYHISLAQIIFLSLLKDTSKKDLFNNKLIIGQNMAIHTNTKGKSKAIENKDNFLNYIKDLPYNGLNEIFYNNETTTGLFADVKHIPSLIEIRDLINKITEK